MYRAGKNLRHKVMSLSALGAGALVFGAGKANAGLIYSGVIDYDITKGSSPYHSGSLGALGATFTFNWGGKTTATSYGSKGTALMKAAGNKLYFEGAAAKMSVFGYGVKWTGKANKNAENVGWHYWRCYVSADCRTSGSGNAAFTNKYALFRFKTGASSWDYGWIELSDAVGTPHNDPNLTIIAWGYDNSGAIIGAGVPEPDTMIPTGLAALAMGAVGLRRWRKARQSV